MAVYWAMFLLPALSAYLVGARRDEGDMRGHWGAAFVFIIFSVLIGLRYETGGDWANYESMVDYIAYERIGSTLAYSDPGFGLVAWISTRLGWGIFGTTFFCGVALMYGIVAFCRRQPDQWLAIAAAVPYLVIVVGMGYIRQAAAIGIILIALISFEDDRRLKAIGLLGVATLFHVSAIILLPIASIVLARRNILFVAPIILVGSAMIFFVLLNRLDSFYEGYVVAEYDSAGALVRLLMNGVPGLLFLIYRKRFPISEAMRLFWTIVSLISVAMLMALFFFSSTTVLDRLALYFIPIQMFVFGSLPLVAASEPGEERVVKSLVILFYGAVLYVWLNFATHAGEWLPYQFIPLDL